MIHSNLQIISGKWRGKKLSLPANSRPTQNKARIALFNILNGLDKEFKTVWDAFAGSGAFGIECLSRDLADAAIFTDTDSDAIKTIHKNLGGTNATVQQIDAINAVSKFGKIADLIFIDPPYSDANLGKSFVRKLSSVAQAGTIAIWEIENNITEKSIPAAKNNSVKDNVGDAATDLDFPGWDIIKDKTYGRARFLFLEKI